MIVFPIFFQSEPDRCPHCGEELPEPDVFALRHPVIATIGGTILFLWLIVTIADWIYPRMTGPQPSLVEVLQGQWKWLTGLRVW